MSDPLTDYHRRDAMQYADELSRPICRICGDPIMGDRLYYISGETYCQECVWETEQDTDNYRRNHEYL